MLHNAPTARIIDVLAGYDERRPNQEHRNDKIKKRIPNIQETERGKKNTGAHKNESDYLSDRRIVELSQTWSSRKTCIYRGFDFSGECTCVAHGDRGVKDPRGECRVAESLSKLKRIFGTGVLGHALTEDFRGPRSR